MVDCDLAHGSIISIHALHEESDASKSSQHHSILFQSTLSMRRATQGARRDNPSQGYFNPRSP